MTISINRTLVKGEITEGLLTIDGKHLCSTLENTYSRLDPGEYHITLVKCKHYSRKMICVVHNPPSANEMKEKCESCVMTGEAYSNTLLPKPCPMLKIGNGVHNRHDGSILVGTRGCRGMIVRSKDAFDPLYERIRKNIERGNDIVLKVF